MRVRCALLLFGAAGFLACGQDDTSTGHLLGVWKGTAPSGLTVSMTVEKEISAGGSVSSVHGILVISDERCLQTAPLGGTLTVDALDLSAAGPGTVSRSTFVDLSGRVEGNQIEGTIEMSGDRQLDACDLARSPVKFVR